MVLRATVARESADLRSDDSLANTIFFRKTIIRKRRTDASRTDSASRRMTITLPHRN